MSLPTLRGRACFARVLGAGQARRSDGVVLHWIQNGLAGNRYGIAAKINTGTAVTRNRVRRWTRELLRRWDSHLAPGYDMVVIARSREAAENYWQFADHLARTLLKADLARPGELS